MTDAQARLLLRQAFEAAVASAQPARVLAAHLPEPPRGRCIVLGAGKAAASMAAAVEAAWPQVDLSGLVVTRVGHAVPTARIAVAQAAHPVPDAAGEAAARRILALAEAAGPDDLVLALISGGGSALLSLPAPGLTLGDKQAVTAALLRSGATIDEMNQVRRALSAIKGGRLGRAASPARLLTLVISDVPGDDPAVIASGPTIAVQSRPGVPGERAAAAAILSRRSIRPPDAVAAFLRQAELPAAPAWSGAVRLVASPSMALDAAAAVARSHGVTPLILGDAIEGESRELGIVLAGIARSVREHGHPSPPPLMLLSGGETVVTMTGLSGAARGGRNTELLLSFAVANAGRNGVWALACDTDGIDGSGDAAGAVVTPSSLARAEAYGLLPRDLLDSHRSFQLFDAIGDLLRTGPTMTNVNDFRAVLIA